MAKILDSVKTFIHEVLTPGYVAKQTEAAYLRQQYNQDSAALPRRDQWYRLLSARGDVVGVEYSCICGVTYPFLSMNDYWKEYNCPTCNHPFSLSKAIGYVEGKNKLSEVSTLMLTLPTRPRLAGKQERKHVDTWEGDRSDVVDYAPYSGKMGM